MRSVYFIPVIFFLTLCGNLQAQQLISGRVLNEEGEPVPSVSVGIKNNLGGTSTDENGLFQLNRPLGDGLILIFSHVAYKRKEIELDNVFGPLEVILDQNPQLLQEIEVAGIERRSDPGLTSIPPIDFSKMPLPGNDFLTILKSMPGVVSNNEMSSAYSVRGGNFDENLVLVNDIPVYRPFLITNGQQEGLSFIVPDFVDRTDFYTAGWQARYGNKISSVLNITYGRPTELKAKAELGLLGWNANLQYGNRKWGVLLSTRRKSTQYLLNGLETEGEYLPKFTDFQSVFMWNPTDKTDIQWLFTYAKNRYLVKPQARQTDFGSFNQSLRLFVAFIGQEIMNYDTYQSAVSIRQEINDFWKVHFTLSAVNSREQEFKNVEGGYRLCDIDRNLDSDTFNKCLVTRGIGTNFEYSRNQLLLSVYDMRLNSIHINKDVTTEWGVQFNAFDINDNAYEYSFIDSSDYVTQISQYNSKHKIKHQTTSIYLQQDYRFNGREYLRYGVRLNYVSISDEWLIAPRVQYTKPVYSFVTDLSLKLSAGIHYQPPVFRELVNQFGELASSPKSQAGSHVTMGFDNYLKIWNRNFHWTGELYGKYFWHVVPYEVDNVRIRYLTDQPTTAYVYGFDSRFGGEFIEGTESWFSLGILSSREKLKYITEDFTRRPSDQRLTVGMYFQDYFIDNPNMRVTIHFQFGSGLPFGPPGDIQNRSIFTGNTYNRLDLGFSRRIELKKAELNLSLDILNVMGVENTITYNWIQDFNGQFIAVPNGLSSRFFNLKAGIKL